MGRRRARSIGRDLAGTPEVVWEALADTARFNEAGGLPKHRVTEELQPDGTVRFIARTKAGPWALEWEDLPCNWVRGRWIEHRRRFRRGPLAVLDAQVEIARHGTGCHVDYRLEMAFAGLSGQLLRLGGFLRRSMRMVARRVAEAERFATGAAPVAFTVAPPRLPPEALARLAQLGPALAASPYVHGLGERLAAHVATAAETDVVRMRPLALARGWGVPALHAIEACLEGTRQGLLELRWDLLCPRCRGAKVQAVSLDRLPEGAHCGTCNIAYDRDFSRNVELAFRPAAAIRPIEDGLFCLLGPMSTPHILAHVTLEPGEVRELAVAAPPGPYRLRTLEAGPQADIEHAGGVLPGMVLGDEGAPGEGTVTATPEPVLANRSGARRTAVIEERSWAADALTADRVATLQAFRDLFADQVLRPGDEVAIRRVTLLFSDLKGSTALYGAIGDAAAYHLVREHFAWLAAIIREHEGAIVKTIGDAVMAAFHDPRAGLRAAFAMQARVADFNASGDAAGERPIVLKLGLHEGPSIAVTMNDRLDYFGGTVNLAARLQSQSRGGDVVVSGVLAATEGIAAIAHPLVGRAETASLRGFAQPMDFVRFA